MFINKTRRNVAFFEHLVSDLLYQAKTLDTDKGQKMKNYKTQAEIKARMAEIDELAKVATPYNIAQERAREWVALRNQLRQIKAKAGN